MASVINIEISKNRTKSSANETKPSKNGTETGEKGGPDDKQVVLEKLRTKLLGIKTIKNINTDDEYLLRWLYSTNFDTEASFLKMKDYHENLVENPNWYQTESPLKKKACFDANAAIMIPASDNEGRPVFISKIGNLDPDKTSFADEACIDDIWYEYILDKQPEIAEKGICMILDFNGISWKYVKMLSYKDVKLSFRKLGTLPFKEFKLHVVNNSRYMRMMLKIVQPFIPEDSKKQIFFHFDDWESLHSHVNKDHLPPEYGGCNKINYKKIYAKLFDKADTITNNFILYRSVIKC